MGIIEIVIFKNYFYFLFWGVGDIDYCFDVYLYSILVFIKDLGNVDDYVEFLVFWGNSFFGFFYFGGCGVFFVRKIDCGVRYYCVFCK